MSFRTTCPKCISVFCLGPDQLAAAQGWVQCSVCGAAFDARISLLMEDGSPLVVEPDPEVESVEAPRLSAFPFTRHDPKDVLALDSAAPEIDAVAVPGGISQRESALDLPSIILIDPDASEPDDDNGPLPQFHADLDVDAVSAIEPGFAPSDAFAALIEYAVPEPGAEPEFEPELESELEFESEPRRVNRWVWALGSLTLLAVLLAQSIYFMRDTLVVQLPQTRPAIEQACTLLGCTLSLPQNPALLQIIGSDLQTEASGRLKLTLTLGNRANHAQAWPMLVLTLTDQRNRALARRSFAPSEYLGDVTRIAAGIPPRSEQPLSLPLTIRDLAPMGFDLKLTY